MLRAIAGIYFESQAVTRRDGYKIFRICNYSSVTASDKTVLSGAGARSAGAAPPPPPAEPPPPPPPSPPPPRARPWAAAAALALTASLGGIYFYQKLNNEDKERPASRAAVTAGEAEDGKAEAAPVPALAEQLPAHAQFLLVGGGTAAFAAMRAIRSARPDAHVLLVGAEPALPYMRPPLSKELWREPDPAAAAAAPDALAFRQWNGRRRSLAYEPEAFYTPPERMRDAPSGAALARGWRVVALDPAARTAVLAAGAQRHELRYDAALLATGARARRLPALRAAATAGRSLALRDVRDAARLARALDAPDVRRVAVVGGGFLATELSAALAARLAAEGAGRRVVQLYREVAPLAHVLPPYLAADVARRLEAEGVELRAGAEVVDCDVAADGVRLRLADGGGENAQLVVECVGAAPRVELAARAGLELADGGVLVNGELAARSGVWVAGDVASFWDEALGRRRVEHHDHAVVSGRLAGENMAGVKPPQVYRHQSMFWSDLGPQLGYEAIGIVDSRLRTVGVFASDAVGAERTLAAAEGAVEATRELEAPREAEAPRELEAPREAEAPQRFERGVVFYLRDERVVGVLLWNLFNRMHVARQVLARGHFDDLLEAAKLFSPLDEE
ncbi:apoptosis-inducing factor 1, mitochondrial-like isoform X2 [Maniola jurtina]|uniref:apoptosis-inducing factor 1, mitochondrial-like isoform X2 n=1 Tax=Maniola jurtina TaxID=191418 RepID=UPI001E68B7C1|nr:apoptosis-inducing factor 1, mitochondrial-like isoform X2 [Maniola jurtina]